METLNNQKNGWILAGADTLAGRYLHPLLNTKPENGDLTLFHCADSDAWPDGRAVDTDATRRLLESHRNSGIKNIVYRSSFRVYSQDAGKGVTESRPLFAEDEAGKRFARSERILQEWAAENGANLTIVRPARMFGSGIGGEMLSLFNRAIRGHYVHVRGNDASLSAVTALDAARIILKLAGTPGIFNISDGNEYSWFELVTAMTANSGAEKRLTTLPAKWVKWINKIFKPLPIVKETMSKEALTSISKTLTLDITRLRELLPDYSFFNTLNVIARREPEYPYKD